MRHLADRGVAAAKKPKKCLDLINQKYYDIYKSKNIQTAMKQCEMYGVDHRNVFNQTLLMVSAQLGNITLAKALLEAGVNSDLRDNLGKNAFQYTIEKAILDKQYAEKSFATFYRLLSPNSVSVQADGKLIKLDKTVMEYFMFYAVERVVKAKAQKFHFSSEVFTAKELANYFSSMPDTVLAPYRKRQAYISSMLSKNEMSSTGPYNRKLFQRVRRGHYILNPVLKVKQGEQWAARTHQACSH
jgi:hypothetical protein